MAKNLIAYFSASGTTAKIARNMAAASGADLYEIAPAQPYTNDDLNWMNKKSRSSVEMNDPGSRPELENHGANIEQYDTVFVGFPIWWYVAPTIINTFLEAYDFSGKKIVLFATSGGSGFGKAVQSLQKSVDASAEIVEGKVFRGSVSEEELKAFVETMQ